MYWYSCVNICSCLCSCIPDVLIISQYIEHCDLQLLIYTHSWVSFFFCDFHSLSFFFNINLCGPTLLGFLVGHRTTLVKTTLSNRLVVGSTWLGVNWSRNLRIEWSLCVELTDKWLLFISNLLECNQDGLNLVDQQIISSWQLMLAWNIRVCSQEEGEVHPFLILSVNLSYKLLNTQGLCHRLCSLKPMLKPFDSEWNYILKISSKLISLLVIWSCCCSNVAKKKVTHLGTSIVQVFW